MANFVESPLYSDRFVKALRFAAIAHRKQVRKQGQWYIGHPLRVAGLVIDACGSSEDEAIAALLHDVMEDCEISFDVISYEFGANIAQIVREVTGETEEYLTKIRSASESALLVSAADKLDNLRGYLATPGLMTDEILDLYVKLSAIYRQRRPGCPLGREVWKLLCQIQ